MVDEYQQVAALVCFDIDTWLETAEDNPEIALECLQELKKMKDEVVNNEEIRNMRYEATCGLFGMIKQ